MKKTQQGPIGRRIEKSIIDYIDGDYESALVHLFPAIDRTAKARRNIGVGARIRSFIEDEEILISFVSFGTILYGNTSNSLTFPQAIYKFGRTSVMHEGELDPRLTFTDDNAIAISDVWKLPSTYILGMIIAVICAKENINEHLLEDKTITFCGHSFDVNNLWGKEYLINEIILEIHPSLIGKLHN